MKDILSDIIKGIIVMAIGAALYAMIFHKTEIITKTEIRYDSTLSKAEKSRYEEIIKEDQNIIEKLLGKNRIAKPVEIVSGPANPSPIKPEPLPPETVRVTGECPQRYEYPFDFIYMAEFDRHSFTLSTINPYLEGVKKDAVKRYTFRREGNSFRLASERNTGDKLEGLKLTWSDPLIYLDGFYIGASIGFPMQWYASFDARMVLFSSIEIRPELRTTETPIWLNVKYRLY